MIDQRSPRRRLLAGLLAGAALAAAGPFLDAVADGSGNTSTSEVRRGAEVRWQVETDDGRHVDYRFWVWQAAFVSQPGTAPEDAEAGWKGEAVAARRVCGSRGCGGFSYWRGPAGTLTSPVTGGNTFTMDIATGLARFQGVLVRANGEQCRVAMDWEAAWPDYTGYSLPGSTAEHDVAVWRRGAGTTGSVGCFGALYRTYDGKVWVNTGI